MWIRVGIVRNAVERWNDGYMHYNEKETIKMYKDKYGINLVQHIFNNSTIFQNCAIMST